MTNGIGGDAAGPRDTSAIAQERDEVIDMLDTLLMHGIKDGGNVIVSRTEWVLVESRFRALLLSKIDASAPADSAQRVNSK